MKTDKNLSYNSQWLVIGLSRNGYDKESKYFKKYYENIEEDQEQNTESAHHKQRLVIDKNLPVTLLGIPLPHTDLHKNSDHQICKAILKNTVHKKGQNSVANRHCQYRKQYGPKQNGPFQLPIIIFQLCTLLPTLF